MRVILVGCGFIGSLFAEELCKRIYATEGRERLELVLVDDDKVDERNPANHLFGASAVGKLKVNALAHELADKYGPPTLQPMPQPLAQRWDAKTKPPTIALPEWDLVVDAVDNLPTRQWLWEEGIRGARVLHLGVSQQGTGIAEWTTDDYDTFSLSPLMLATYTKEQLEAMTKLQRLPPCELLAFRGVGLLTALCGARAACATIGFDPEGDMNKRRYLSFVTNHTGFQQREAKELT